MPSSSSCPFVASFKELRCVSAHLGLSILLHSPQSCHLLCKPWLGLTHQNATPYACPSQIPSVIPWPNFHFLLKSQITFFTIHCTTHVGVICKLTNRVNNIVIQIVNLDDKPLCTHLWPQTTNLNNPTVPSSDSLHQANVVSTWPSHPGSQVI